jgi:glycosyltransferase involved in cell wall biosynthesis
MNFPYIDVIVAVYNGEKYIKDTIVSIQAQSWKNVNIIIVDDGSTDNTLSVVSVLSKTDPRIKILSCPHKGVSATLNVGIKVSSAPYIAFLDADDLWHENKLEKQMQALSKSEEKICFCLVQEFESLDEVEIRTHSARSGPMQGYSKTAFLGERVAIGDFVDWYAKLVRAEEPIIMLEEVLTFRRIHQHNTTRSASKSDFLKLIKTHLDEKRKNTGV